MSLYIDSVYTKESANGIFSLARQAAGIQWVEPHVTKGTAATQTLQIDATYKKFTGFDINAIDGGKVVDKSGAVVAGKFAYEALQEGGQKTITFSAADASITSVDFVYKRYAGKLATSGGKQPIAGPDAINEDSNEIIGHGNIVVSCTDTTCIGIDNTIYALPPFGLTETADILISLTLVGQSFILGEVIEGHRRGLYPLSYCDLTQPCDVLYSLNGGPKTQCGQVQFNNESDASFPKVKVLLTIVDNPNAVFYLKAKQFVGQSDVSNNKASMYYYYTRIDNVHTYTIMFTSKITAEMIDYSVKPILIIYHHTTEINLNYQLPDYITLENPSFTLPDIIPGLVNDDQWEVRVIILALIKNDTNTLQYKNNILLGKHNDILGGSNLTIGNDNNCSYCENTIVGKNNNVDGYNNIIKGDNNILTCVNTTINGSRNIANISAFVSGNDNYITKFTYTYVYSNYNEYFNLCILPLNIDYTRYPVTKDNWYTNSKSISYFSPDFIQKSNSQIEQHIEVVTITNRIIDKLSETMKNITYYFVFNWPYNYEISLINSNGEQRVIRIFNKVWLSDNTLHFADDIPNGTYTMKYYAVRFLDTGRQITNTVLGSDNKIYNNIWFNEYINNVVVGDFNITQSPNTIYGSLNLAAFRGATIFGNGNKSRMNTNTANIEQLMAGGTEDEQNAFLKNFFPDDQKRPEAYNCLIIGDNNTADVISTIGHNSNQYTDVIITGLRNNASINGYGTTFNNVLINGLDNYIYDDGNGMDNVILVNVKIDGSTNVISLEDNSAVSYSNIIGANNTINAYHNSEIFGSNIIGYNNTLSTSDIGVGFSLSDVIILGASNKIYMDLSISISSLAYYTVIGKNNFIRLMSPGDQDIICLAHSCMVENCSNIAIIGQTNYAKTDLHDTIIIPGMINCGAEVIKVTNNPVDTVVTTTTITLTDTDKLRYITNGATVDGIAPGPIQVVFSQYAPVGRVIEIILDLTTLVDVTFTFPQYSSPQTVRAMVLNSRQYSTVSTNVVDNNITVNGVNYPNYANYLIPANQVSGKLMTFRHVTETVWVVE